jgi:PAS domain S-box-containing protein
MGKIKHQQPEQHSPQTANPISAQGTDDTVVVFTGAMSVMPQTFSLQMALEQTMNALWSYTQAPAIALFALDTDSETLKMVAGRGFITSTLQVGQELPLKGSLSGVAVARREIVTSESLRQDARVEPAVQKALAAQGFRFVMSIPLLFQEHVVGVVNLIYTETPDDASIDPTALTFMAHSISAIMVGLYDLRELQKVEEALRRSEGQFRRLAESSPDYVFVLDLKNFQTVYANRDTFLGYEREEWRDRSVFDHVHPDDNELVLAFFREFVETLMAGNVPTIEYRLETKDGQWEWVQHRGAVFTSDAENKPVQVIIMLAVVTERKRAEQALHESENRYRELFDNAPVALYTKDREGRYTSVNKDTLHYWAVNPLGHTDTELLVAEIAAAIRGNDIRVMETGQETLTEERVQMPDGLTQAIVLSHKVPLRDDNGTIVGVAGMSIDITERKSAEEALRQSEEQYRQLFEQSLDAIYVASRDGRALDFNEAAMTLFGYSREEILQLSITDLYPTPEERLRFQKAIEITGSVANFPVQLRRKNGDYLDCLLTSAVVVNSEGQVVGYQGIIRDVTEQKRLESQVQEALARRGRQVALSTQIAQETAAAANPEELYRRVVEQVQELFGFYHTQLLLYNPREEAAVLTFGYGAVGKKMLATGHKMALGTGLIGVAAATGQSVLRPDVSLDPNWKSNPLLPDTRGELAVPIKLKETVLGVLDVQANVAGQLSTEDQLVLEGLCGQIAIAIENTRLLEEASIFRQFVEFSSQGMGFVDLNARVAYTNPALLKLLGYHNPSDVFGRSFTDFYPEHLHEALYKDVQQSVMKGNQWNGELTMRSVEGHLIPTYESFVLLYDQRGNPRYIADLVTDMTARKQADLDLQERLVELNNLQRYMSKEGWQTYHAAAGERPQGFTFDQRSVQPIANGNGTNHPDDHESTISGQTTQTIISHLSIGGEIIGLLGIETDLNAPLTREERSLLDEISIQVAGALENARLSEQTRIALSGQERLSSQLATVAEVSAIASTILEEEQLLQAVVDLSKIQFNLYHAQIFIYDENTQRLRLRAGSDQIGRLMVYEKYTLPLTSRESPVSRAAVSRQAVLEEDIRSQGITVHPYLPETHSQLAIPITQGEKLLGVIDLHANTASFFTAEDIRVYTTLSLQVAVALQNAYLYAEQLQTAEQLREVDRLKSEFLASMSHELRTPLNSIVGFADVLLEGLDGDLNERMEEDVHLIRQSGIHLRELISDILDMSKIEAGMMELRFEEIDVREMAEEMVATNKPSAQTNKKHLDMQLEVNPDVTTVVADRTRLRQIFHNLISNAIKFTERGFVRVAINKRDDDLVVAVQDTGIGIRPEDTAIVFERFRQIDGSLTRQAGGTGLGMPITKELVELHGGRIWLDSQIGDGTTFWFTIPLFHKIKKRETLSFR